MITLITDKHLNDTETLDLEYTVDMNLQLGAHSGKLYILCPGQNQTQTYQFIFKSHSKSNVNHLKTDKLNT